jgi:hypothetical protein
MNFVNHKSATGKPYLGPTKGFPFNARNVDPAPPPGPIYGPLPETISPSDLCKDGPVSFSALLDLYVPPVPELVTGLIERDIFTMLSGPGGSHKSRLAITTVRLTANELSGSI